MVFDHSKKLFEKAKKVIPGGVNSPVRAFKAVGGTPLFIKKAKGAYLYDEDGNRFIDMISSWGPMILGHANEMILDKISEQLPKSLSYGAPTSLEVEMAELMCGMVPGLEKVRMVNSGTEATMSAIRLARGYTGRDKIIKFEGCYHGHGDSFLIAAGSGAITHGEPNSPGVTKGTALDTLTAPYNDIEAIKSLIDGNKDEIAAIILEPVAGNMGCVIPHDQYLKEIRELCNQEKIVLIFDEVMTGFRLAPGGAQELLGVKADLVTFGKIIGGGMPVGAYGGKEEIMNYVSPTGPVYQAGTLSGNPVAMSAGIAMLSYLKNHPEVYVNLEKVAKTIVDGWKETLNSLGLDYSINQIGSMFCMFFTSEKVSDFEGAKKSDLTLFASYFQQMLREGIYLPPSQFEAAFLSTAISEQNIEEIITAHRNSLKKIL